ALKCAGISTTPALNSLLRRVRPDASQSEDRRKNAPERTCMVIGQLAFGHLRPDQRSRTVLKDTGMDRIETRQADLF
ncbi:MAG: hypothetical protein WA924_07170, partial [Burkholderiaceae bacterium]